MKVTFPTENDKQLAIQTARRKTLEECGQVYLYFLEEAIVDGIIEPKVVEASLVDENVEQIKI